MVLKFYYDFLSQPCRSLYILLKLTNTSFQPVYVNLLKGEQLSKEFRENCSKFQKVPVIHDGEFRLTERRCKRMKLKLYQLQAAASWCCSGSEGNMELTNHRNAARCSRSSVKPVSFIWFIVPIKTGMEPSEQNVSRDRKALLGSLNDFERLFLEDGPFILGNKISCADIFAATEVEQPRFGGYDPRNDYPKIKSWLENVKKECNPYYDEAHKIIDEVGIKKE